jgi:RND family efflux transporter MFP subunit
MITHDEAIRFVAAGASLVAVITGAACARTHATAGGAAGDGLVVAVAKVARGDLSQTLTLAAEFRPYQEVDVHAKVAGFLQAIYVDVGDRVKQGQLLALLEIPELHDDLHQDEAAVKRSAEEIKRAQADLERAQSGHDVAHLAAGRLSEVLKARPNLIAQQDIDEATARDRMAEAQVATAQAALASAGQQLEVSKAAASRTQALVDYARITAPFAGVVTHRYADTGAMIQAGTSSQSQAMPLVQLSQNSRLRLIIPVPESAVARVQLGEPVEVRVDALGRTFPGTVARFANKLSPDTRTMDTEVDVSNENLELVPGMYAHADIALHRVAGVLTIPVQALDRDERKASVMLVRSGTIERRDVQTGLETPDRVEIVSGLRDGDLVVVGSRSQLRAGASVTPKIVEPAATEGKS